MRGLLTSNCPASTETAPPPPQKEETSPPAPAETTPGNSSTQTPTTTPAAQPLTVDEELTTELPSIPQVQAMNTTRNGSVLAYAPYVFPLATAQKQATVLGATNSGASLQASPEGWKFWGIAWYWWVLVITGLGVLYGLSWLAITKSIRMVVK